MSAGSGRRRLIYRRRTGRREAYIRADCLFGFESLISSHGGDPFGCAERAGLPREAFRNSNMLISWPRQGIFCELAARELDRPNFGLEHASSLPDTYPNAGAAIFLSQITETFEEWFHAYARYGRYCTDAWTARLIANGSAAACVRLLEDPQVHSPRHQTEGLLASLYRMARSVLGAEPHEKGIVVRFRHPRPPDIRLHEEIFGCPVEFEAAHNEFIFPGDYLTRPTNGRLAQLKVLLDAHLHYRMDHMPRHDQSIRATVEAGIPAVLGTSLCNAGHFAMSLGLGPKKMQRLLAEEGTSFSLLLDNVREALAREMLETTDIPVGNIGGMLGYAALQSFNLAFKRWTGMPPSVYREVKCARSARPASHETEDRSG